MADDNATEPATPPGDERDDDVFAARVRATREQVDELIRRDEFDYGDRPHFSAREGDATGELDLFVSRAQIERLRADGFEVQVVSNQSAQARERLKDVGEGDRFEGGKIPPTGLGRKFRDDEPRGEERPS
jgi:hypothetical protein